MRRPPLPAVNARLDHDPVDNRAYVVNRLSARLLRCKNGVDCLRETERSVRHSNKFIRHLRYLTETNAASNEMSETLPRDRLSPGLRAGRTSVSGRGALAV